MVKKSKILAIYDYIIAVALMINCRTIWLTKVPPISKLDGTLWLALLISILAIVTLNYQNDESKFQHALIISMFLFFYFGIYIFLSSFPGTRNYGVRYASVFIMLVWLLYYDDYINDIPGVLLKYKNVIFIVALISLLFWLFGSLLGLIKPTGAIWTAWTGTGRPASVPSYFGIYFETQSVTTDIGGFIRNTAIYPEAPMSSLNFCIALGIQVLSKQSNKWGKIQFWILLIAILSTGSTTGYIFLAVLLAFKINNSNNFLLEKFKSPLFILILIFTAISVSYLIHQKTIYGIDSANLRIDDYKVGYRAWIQHPILGSGIENDEYVRQFVEPWRSYNIGFSNSPLKVLSDGGIYLFLGYLYCFVRGIFLSIYNKDKYKFIFIVLILYLFITTIFHYTYLLFLLLIWFTKRKDSTKSNVRNHLIEDVN